MGKEEYLIGIIDDDSTKVTQLITNIMLCCNDEDGRPLKENYSNYKLIPVELLIMDSTDKMVEQVVTKHLDAVIIDYKLSSQKAICYSGVSVANEINSRLYNFPVFVLTTYQDDLFEHELFDSYLVFDFARYIGDEKARVELNSKLIQQIRKYRIEIKNWKEELLKLLPQEGKSEAIDERILELDTRLEKSINGNGSISIPIKRSFTSDKINELISKIDSLIEGE